MNGNDLITSIVALGGVPLILGLVQLFKPFITDTRYYPLVGLAFGLIINLVAGWVLGASIATDWVTALLNGIIAGLAALVRSQYPTSSSPRRRGVRAPCSSAGQAPSASRGRCVTPTVGSSRRAPRCRASPARRG